MDRLPSRPRQRRRCWGGTRVLPPEEQGVRGRFSTNSLRRRQVPLATTRPGASRVAHHMKNRQVGADRGQTFSRPTVEREGKRRRRPTAGSPASGSRRPTTARCPHGQRRCCEPPPLWSHPKDPDQVLRFGRGFRNVRSRPLLAANVRWQAFTQEPRIERRLVTKVSAEPARAACARWGPSTALGGSVGSSVVELTDGYKKALPRSPVGAMRSQGAGTRGPFSRRPTLPSRRRRSRALGLQPMGS